MARIEGINIPKDKRIVIALTYIAGIGRSSAKMILENVNVDESKKVNDLSEQEVLTISNEIKRLKDKGELIVEGDLRRKLQMDIKRLQEAGTYRGFRHRKGLPVRGQRTQVNGRTRKGKKKTVANKKKATK